MKIIFIANSGAKHDAARYYLSERRFYNGFVRNGHDVWFFADREEIRAASPLYFRPIGKHRVNQKLLRTIENFQPQAIFLLNANIISPQTLAQIKKDYQHIKIVQIIYDALFVAANRAAWKERLEHIDLHFFTTAGNALADFSVHQRPCYFIPNPSDHAIDTGRVFENPNPKYDVTCVLTASRDRQELENNLLQIQKELPSLNFAYRGFGANPSVRGSAYVDLLKDSAMALNLSRASVGDEQSTKENRYLYSSDRIAQLMGNGCLTFIEDIFGLDDLYQPDEVVFFNNKQDLKEKIRYYAEHPQERQRIAQNGWTAAHQEFSADLVTRYMLERTFDQALSHAYRWPTKPVIKAP